MNNPLSEGLDFTGRAAIVFDPYFSDGASTVRLSGLGVLDCENPVTVGDCNLDDTERKVCAAGVAFVDGVFNVLVVRPRTGVPSIGGNGTRKVFVEARKLTGLLSSRPELELGRLWERREGGRPSEK